MNYHDLLIKELYDLQLLLGHVSSRPTMNLDELGLPLAVDHRKEYDLVLIHSCTR